jgi:ankyrin repeat protein
MGRTTRKWTSLEELLLAISDVLVLEKRSIDVNEVGYDNDRPLHVAAVWGDIQAIEMLVAAGAELDAQGELGCTPLYNAVGQKHVAAARRLLELGASPNIRSELGMTAAELARFQRMRELVALFDHYAA